MDDGRGEGVQKRREKIVKIGSPELTGVDGPTSCSQSPYLPPLIFPVDRNRSQTCLALVISAKLVSLSSSASSSSCTSSKSLLLLTILFLIHFLSFCLSSSFLLFLSFVFSFLPSCFLHSIFLPLIVYLPLSFLLLPSPFPPLAYLLPSFLFLPPLANLSLLALSYSCLSSTFLPPPSFGDSSSSFLLPPPSSSPLTFPIQSLTFVLFIFG